MEKFKAALPDLKMKKLVTFWPPPLGSKTIVAEDRNPITQKAKPEAVPPGCSWTLLPGGVRAIVMAKAVLT